MRIILLKKLRQGWELPTYYSDEADVAFCDSGRLAVQMAFHCYGSVLRRDRGAALYVEDIPVINLPEQGNNLSHFAPFLPYRFVMHL